MTLPWVSLILAGLLEVVWASGLKSTNGFTRLWPSLWVVASMIASMSLLSWSVRTLPASTAYAVWVGIGAVGVAIVGMTLLKEPVHIGRLACIVLIVIGVAGLKLMSPTK